MHTLLAALFAMLFSSSHAAPMPSAQPALAPQAFVYAAAPSDRVSSRLAAPRLRHTSSYAVSACVSCRRTNVTYRVH